MKFVLKVLITAVNAFVLAYLLPGISINHFFTAIAVAFVLALLDAVVKPILVLFTLPATIFTLGLFLFVINACIILLDAYFVKGFIVDGFNDLKRYFFWQFYKENSCFMNQGLYLTQNYQNQDRCRKI